MACSCMPALLQIDFLLHPLKIGVYNHRLSRYEARQKGWCYLPSRGMDARKRR